MRRATSRRPGRPRAVGITSCLDGNVASSTRRWGEDTPYRIRYVLLAAATVLATQLLLVVLVTESGLATSSLAVLSAVSVLPVVIVVAFATALCGRWWTRPAADIGDRSRLAARAADAERALAHSQDRIHELRATLGGLRLSNQLLVDRRAALSRAAHWRLQTLHTAELARVERLLTTGPPDEVTTVDLADVLAPLVQVVALQGCAVQWPGTSAHVWGRADDLTGVAHVLLDNAVRHAAGRGVALRVTSRGGWVELRVRDAGPGVPRALAPVVFERGSRSQGSRGEGIGLHAARRLARELGGDLTLETNHSIAGAEFLLRLPEATGQAPCLAAAV